MLRAVILLVWLLTVPVQAADVRFARIPLDGNGIAADDLIDPQTGRKRVPEQAAILPDLLALNPAEDPRVWRNLGPRPLDREIDDRLPLQSGDTVEYNGKIDSQMGLLRMAVQL